MAAKKCTHPKGYDRGGRCPLCRQRKPGRPAKARTTKPPQSANPPLPTAPLVAPAVRKTQPAFLPTIDTSADRTSRIDAALPTPSPPPEPDPDVEPEPEPEPEPDPEPSNRTAFGYGWDWTARKITTGLDMGIGIAIDRFLDREPLDAGEEETNELVRVTAEYGERRLGKVEAPIWLVFLIALAFFFTSKFAGAPKKAPAAKPVALTPGKATQPDAVVAATKTPDVAAGAATQEIVHPTPAAPANTGGSVGAVMAGY
jgi:hypothetical protein